MTDNATRNLNIICAVFWIYILSGATVENLSVFGAALEIQFPGVLVAAAWVALVWFFYKYQADHRFDAREHRDLLLESAAEWTPKRVRKRIEHLLVEKPEYGAGDEIEIVWSKASGVPALLHVNKEGKYNIRLKRNELPLKLIRRVGFWGYLWKSPDRFLADVFPRIFFWFTVAAAISTHFVNWEGFSALIFDRVNVQHEFRWWW